MTKKYQSEQLMICHQDAEALYRIGAISEDEMREFDKECLVQEPEAAKETAEMEHISPATI
jgi:DNA-binding transcriptional regulator YiaG